MNSKQKEALLAYALVMAVTAPKHRAAEALASAQDIGQGMSERQVTRAKKSAERVLGPKA